MFDTMSPKQMLSYAESNSRLNFWVGAVRSGKSFGALLRFIKFVRFGPAGDCVIVGRSKDTLRRNVVTPLQDLLGMDVKYRYGTGEITLWGRKIYVVGAADERAEGRIRGWTIAGALVDELTLLPESFFKMLLSRLSISGAQLFGTTNPDSPFHWLKRDYIDKEGLDCKVFNFNLNDNPSLTEDYKQNICREYTGLWYQRFIEGKWVLAEGTIFDFFDTEKHVISYPPGNADYYICGIDYGTTNPTAFALIGYSSRTYPNKWLEKEYYWDSRRELRQKTDSEYADDLKKFLSGYRVRAIYLDPAAASFKVELQRAGFSILDAKNEVLDGIRYHSNELMNGNFKICHNCTNAIKEYSTYSWDPRSQKIGEDRPLKENDHCFAAGTFVYTIEGNKPIELIETGDLVLTRAGFKRVYGTWKSEKPQKVIQLTVEENTITCTPGHKFFVSETEKKPASDLTQYDTLFKIDPQKIAEEILKQELPITDSVLTLVNQHIEEKMGSMTLLNPVHIAQKNSPQINTQKLIAAHTLAQQNTDGLLEDQIVYNLTIEDKNEFFANGILVANCMDAIRYSLFTHFFNQSAERLTAEDIDRQRREAWGETGGHGAFFEGRMW